MGSVLFLLLLLPSLYGDNNILGLSRSKVAQIVLQGRKLSSNPFAFYSSPQHCVLLNWLWTCWCASSSCSGDARPYKWVWVWRGGKKKKKIRHFACESGCRIEGEGGMMDNRWRTTDKTAPAVLAPGPNLVLGHSQAHKNMLFLFFFIFLSIYCI